MGFHMKDKIKNKIENYFLKKNYTCMLREKGVFNGCGKVTGVTHVGGDMFKSIPTGDAIFMKVRSFFVFHFLYREQNYIFGILISSPTLARDPGPFPFHCPTINEWLAGTRVCKLQTCLGRVVLSWVEKLSLKKKKNKIIHRGPPILWKSHKVWENKHILKHQKLKIKWLLNYGKW